MIRKDLEACANLISKAINETLDRYAGTNSLSIYAWGYLEYYEEGFTVGSNSHTVFYPVHEVITICAACGCDYYLCMRENRCGKMTPAIHIY